MTSVVDRLTVLYDSHIVALHAGVIVVTGSSEAFECPRKETIMNRRIAMVIALVLVAVALAGVIGTTAYRAGLARGLADAGHVPGPWLYHAPYWYAGPFGFLFPLLGLFIILALVRGLFWRGWYAGGAARGRMQFPGCSRSGIAGLTSPRRRATPPAD